MPFNGRGKNKGFTQVWQFVFSTTYISAGIKDTFGFLPPQINKFVFPILTEFHGTETHKTLQKYCKK